MEGDQIQIWKEHLATPKKKKKFEENAQTHQDKHLTLQTWTHSATWKSCTFAFNT